MKKFVINLSILSILGLFSCNDKRKEYQIEPIFNEMREMAFSITPEKINFETPDDKTVFAVFMETGYSKNAMSLRCIGDGTISILFTNGGGMIGIGEHESAKAEGLKLLQMASDYITKFKTTDTFRLPVNGETIFYFRTLSGTYFLEEKEKVLGNNKSEFSPLFYQAQNVITQARLIQESK